MKKLLLYLAFAVIGITFLSSNLYVKNEKVEKTQQQKYSKVQIEAFIREVFKENADEMVIKSNSRRLEIITDFLNRVEILERTDLSGKNIQLLSTVPINNKYNPNLKLDTYYDADTFNPLKYNFNMSSKEVLLYRLDNSNFIIKIFPIN